MYSSCELKVEKLNPYVIKGPCYISPLEPNSDKAVDEILLQNCAFSSKDIQLFYAWELNLLCYFSLNLYCALGLHNYSFIDN